MIDAYLSFGRSKDWLVDSASFARTATSDGAKILTNNHTIAYLSGRVSNYDEVSRELRSSEYIEYVTWRSDYTRVNPREPTAFESGTSSGANKVACTFLTARAAGSHL